VEHEQLHDQPHQRSQYTQRHHHYGEDAGQVEVERAVGVDVDVGVGVDVSVSVSVWPVRVRLRVRTRKGSVQGTTQIHICRVGTCLGRDLQWCLAR